MQTPRELAFRFLLQWVNLSDPPFLPGRTDAVWAQLSPRDRAFAFDLITGIIRWRSCLDAVISSRIRQPLESLDHPVRAILWLGAYQLLFQSGTADYAAVDTTVTLARKNHDTAAAAGLVNAVLRGITRLTPTVSPISAKPPAPPRLSRRSFALDFDNLLTLGAEIFCPPSALDAHLATVRSHPSAYVKHLRKIYGDDLAAHLLLRNNLRPVVTLRVDGDSLDVPASAGLIAHAEAPRFLVAAEGWNPIIEEFVTSGKLSPQDPTSAKSIRTLAQLVADEAMREPVMILDLCAGLGTKALQLARAFPAAQITATDIDAPKIARLRTRAAQMKLTNLATIPIAELPPEKRFDVVLLDVPCSNTGVMASRVQSRCGAGLPLDHAALHTLQMDLLRQGAAFTVPNGTVLYATCSIDPEENETLITRFLEKLIG